jgi:predicted RND superfamily exporter protein
MERIVGLLTRHPVWVVLAVVAITAFFVSRMVDLRTGATHLRVDPSTKMLLPDDDVAHELLDQAQRQFAGGEALILALAMNDVFSPESLRIVKRVTEQLQAVDGVERVVSLATAPNVRSHGDDIEIAPFLATLPSDREGAEQIRSDVLGNPLYAGSLVSLDARATALIVQLQDMPDQEFIDRAIDREVAAAAASGAGDAEVWMTGPPYIKAETSRIIFESLSRILPISFAIMAVIGLLAFRSLRGVLVPISTVAIALVWTLGAVAWSGVALNLVTTIVPPLLLTIGFAYAVHVVSAFAEARRVDPDEVAAAGGPAAWSMRHVALPVVLTGLTTGIGFVSLTLSSFAAVREFGWISVLGVAISVLLTLTFAPAALALAPPPPAVKESAEGTRLLDRWFVRLGEFNVRHRVPILGAGAVLAALSFWGMTRIEIRTDLVSGFNPEHPAPIHFQAINESLQGAMLLDIIIEADRENGLLEPENLHAIESMQEWLARQPEVGGSTSLVDHIKVIHRTFHEGDPSQLRIPANARLAQQLLLFGGGEELARFVDRSYRMTRVQVRTRAPDSGKVARLVDRIEERLQSLPPALEAHVTGSTVLLARSIDAVSKGQVTTLSTAFVFIYAVLVLLFTSFRVGLVALIPNALPVILYFGVLGFSGIPLNATTGLFACIVLGIAVDDTIHLLSRFNEEARQRVDERAGAVHALRSVGRPVTITTLALCLGFLTLTASDLRSQVEFGALGAFILFCAWGVDVTFTPALCAGMRIVTLWDALTYDLGTDPQESIPILRGLSNAQARIAALMTRVDTFPAGSPVFRTGDPGDEVFVVLDGETVASIEADGARIELSRAYRGDLVGEVALHLGKRTADVDAVTDLRVLRLNKENLMRLRNRYPRIGSRLFWNLSEILAERVANLTQKVG